MQSSSAPTDAPDDDKLSAIILNHIPSEGTTLSRLVQEVNAQPDRVELAVQRLLNMRLIERTGDVIQGTPFVQKARSFFKFVP